jgi:hypothetical protein
MTEATVDMAYAKSIVEAVEQGCNYEDKCLAVRDLLARHRQSSVPVQGEPVAFRYDCIKAVGNRKHLDPSFHAGHRCNMDPKHWTETPLYTHAPTERERVLLEALKAARQIITDIDDYMKEPDRGDWGVECALCMGELLDDDRQAIANIDAAIAQAQEPE